MLPDVLFSIFCHGYFFQYVASRISHSNNQPVFVLERPVSLCMSSIFLLCLNQIIRILYRNIFVPLSLAVYMLMLKFLCKLTNSLCSSFSHEDFSYAHFEENNTQYLTWNEYQSAFNLFCKLLKCYILVFFFQFYYMAYVKALL